MRAIHFTAEVAKRTEKASFISLCGPSVLCGEIWVITSEIRCILTSVNSKDYKSLSTYCILRIDCSTQMFAQADAS